MKKNYFLVSLLLLITSYTMSKTNDVISEDKLLQKLQKALPKGWHLLTQADELIIEREDSVLLLHQNMINVDFRSYEELEDKIKKEGKKTKLRMIYTLESKWDDEKIKKHKKEESAVWISIENLLEKYKLKHLVSKQAKGDTFFREEKASDEEKKRIELFYKEKKELDEKAYQLNAQLPSYHSERYSLIVKYKPNGFFEHVLPNEATVERFQIEQLMGKILTPIK